MEDVVLKDTDIDPTQEDVVMAFLVNKVGFTTIIKLIASSGFSAHTVNSLISRHPRELENVPVSGAVRL